MTGGTLCPTSLTRLLRHYGGRRCGWKRGRVGLQVREILPRQIAQQFLAYELIQANQVRVKKTLAQRHGAPFTVGKGRVAGNWQIAKLVVLGNHGIFDLNGGGVPASAVRIAW